MTTLSYCPLHGRFETPPAPWHPGCPVCTYGEGGERPGVAVGSCGSDPMEVREVDGVKAPVVASVKAASELTREDSQLVVHLAPLSVQV